MRKVIYSMFGLAVLLFASSCEKKIEQPNPTLTLSQTEVSVPADGGTYSVAYKVTNPRDGAKVSAEVAEDWVTDVTVTAQDITFVVLANETTSERTASVTVSYPGISSDAEFTIIQAAGEPAPFTIDIYDVTETSATMDVIPQDKEMGYIMFIAEKSYLDENGLNTDEALYEDDKAYIESMLGYGYTIDDFVYYGDKEGVSTSGLTPGTEYVVYAYGIDVQTLERLTDIVYAYATTSEVEIVDVSFTLGEPVVNGPEVTVSVTPDGYDGWWSAYAFETTTLDPEVSLFDHCSSVWNDEMALYQMFGMSNEEILSMLCLQGPIDLSFTDLTPNTAYTIVVFAVSDNCLINSEPVSVEVTTGSVEASDNVIGIDVTDITGSTASISFTPSNDDPYGFNIYATSDLEGMTDEEILDMASSDYYLNVTSGPNEVRYTGLTPETGFSVVVFGYQSGQVTTGLFREDFTTIEGVSGSVEFELQHDDYYDIVETAAAFNAAGYTEDGEYLETLATQYDALMPATPVTTPEVGTFYYLILSDVPDNHLDNPEDYLSFILQNGSSQESVFFTLNYDEPLFAVGVAVNDYGEPGPVWVGDSFTLTSDGVSDPQGFIDFIYGPASKSISSVAPRSASTRLYVSGSGVKRYEPSTKVMRTYNGDKAKYVRMSGIETPAADPAALQAVRPNGRIMLGK